MEERRQGAILATVAGDIRSFPRIAARACVGEVCEGGITTVFPADDVVNLVRLEGVFLMEEAIFASMPGSARDRNPVGPRDRLTHL